ncbi:hypothetical protein Acr_23g0020950 [Actinidia rufa]|uniref:Uncharacterized protein n=1 Tax=Actinidia rufa TaxID=165716 RepID=A0A7J0GSA5_9ERIC|nr:hypothetical protein Acr_23g0020950 [Actinidia rufa]
MGSQPLDQVGINTEVASVIREFTEPIIEDEDIYSEENSTSDFGDEIVSNHPLLLDAAADSSEGLPPTTRRCFTHEIGMGPLTEEQRAEMLSQSLHVSGLRPNVDEHSGQTSGFMPRDTCAVIADAGEDSENIRIFI